MANSFLTALTTYNELKESAKIIVAVSNYCKWPLKVSSIEVIKGQTNSAMAVAAPNSKSGWTASEKPNIFLSGGSEGYAVWTMGPGSLCVIYWRVGQQEGFEKVPNAMAVGCMSFEKTTVDDWEETIQNVKSDPVNRKSPYLEYHTYDTSQPVIQFCNDYICVQGILFSASQGEAKIEIFPLNATNVAPSLQETLTQELIDSVTERDEKFGNATNRERSDSLNIGAIIGIAVGAIVAIFLVVFVCIVCRR